MNELVIAFYDLVAFSGVLLLMYVIRQAQNDLHLNRTDRPRVMHWRKVTFFADAVYVLLTIFFQDYWLAHPSVIVTGLVVTGHVAGGMSILAVSVVSMRERAPPSHGHGFRVNTGSIWRSRFGR
jgi:hypothetical protein